MERVETENHFHPPHPCAGGGGDDDHREAATTTPAEGQQYLRNKKRKRKKQHSRQCLLDQFFHPKKRCSANTTTTAATEGGGAPAAAATDAAAAVAVSVFVSLPDSIWEKNIFAYLSTWDVTMFSHTCHYVKNKVQLCRGGGLKHRPQIIKDELCPTPKLAYYLKELRYDDNSYYLQRLKMDAFHSQTYRFWIKSNLHGKVRVQIRLLSYLWTETDWNARNYVEAFYYDDRTHIVVDMYRTIVFKDGSTKDVLFFSIPLEDEYMYTPLTFHDGSLLEDWHYESCPLCSREDEEETFSYCFADNSEELHGHLPFVAAQELSSIIRYYWLCAKRAYEMDALECPPVDYMMEVFPDEYLLYFPLEYKLPRSTDEEIVDRKQPLWLYRRPGSCDQWVTYLWGRLDHNLRAGTDRWFGEFDIWELPWYRDWYPKATDPIDPSKQNVLADVLPVSIFRRSLLPLLTSRDMASLVVACPGLAFRVCESLRTG